MYETGSKSKTLVAQAFVVVLTKLLRLRRQRRQRNDKNKLCQTLNQNILQVLLEFSLSHSFDWFGIQMIIKT